jgi:hypothetical protein
MKTSTEQKLIAEWEADDDEYDYMFMCDDLDEIMKNINPTGQWHVTVENAGWQARSGWMNVKATNSRKLLESILPRTECTFKVYLCGKGFGRYLKIQNFHHDSPVGNEWYTVVRFSGKKNTSRT